MSMERPARSSAHWYKDISAQVENVSAWAKYKRTWICFVKAHCSCYWVQSEDELNTKATSTVTNLLLTSVHPVGLQCTGCLQSNLQHWCKTKKKFCLLSEHTFVSKMYVIDWNCNKCISVALCKYIVQISIPFLSLNNKLEMVSIHRNPFYIE